MKRKLVASLAFSVFLGLVCFISAHAYVVGAANLDIVVRDFPVNHPDFENFSEEFVSHGDNNYCQKQGSASGMCGELIYAKGVFGYDANWWNFATMHNTCGNMYSRAGAWIGQDGYPNVLNPFLPSYLQAVTSSDTLKYGECKDKKAGRVQRGYEKYVDGKVSGTKCNGVVWSNPVYYTPGMVQPYLQFDLMTWTGEYDMLDGVHILKAQDLCDNTYFDQWFSDNNPYAKRSNMILELIPLTQAGSSKSIYAIDYNYSNGGYFPLDIIDTNTQIRSDMATKANGGCTTDQCDQWGPQSLSIFCPPYDYQYADTQTDMMGQKTDALCKQWLAYGGPRYPGTGDYMTSAAFMAAAGMGNLGLQHIRNYGFTMMGYAKFKYNSRNQVNANGLPDPEVFEFAGADDMWIFVDGVLVVDLGGTHLPAPGRVDISVLAKNGHGCKLDPALASAGFGEPPLAGQISAGQNCQLNADGSWADNTWHHLHFFYANRQSDGSNMYMKIFLAELAPIKYGQPDIIAAKVSEKDGEAKVSLTLNTELSSETLALMQSSMSPSFVVAHCSNYNIATSSCMDYDTLGLYVTDARFVVDKGVDGMVYDIQGVVRDQNGNVSTIQAGDQIAFNYPNVDPLSETYNKWTALMSFYITSKAGKTVETFPSEWTSIGFNPDTYNQEFAKPSFRIKMTGPFEFAIVFDDELPAKARTYTVMDLQGNILRQGEVVSSETVVEGLSAGSYIVKSGYSKRRVNIR